jgi:hypothetical protein
MTTTASRVSFFRPPPPPPPPSAEAEADGNDFIRQVEDLGKPQSTGDWPLLGKQNIAVYLRHLWYICKQAGVVRKWRDHVELTMGTFDSLFA